MTAPPRREYAPQHQGEEEQRNEEREPVRQETTGGMSGGSFMEQEVQRLLGTSAVQIQRLAEEFTRKYKKLTSEGERAVAIATYFMDVNQWRN